jgi:hypothetical protein
MNTDAIFQQLPADLFNPSRLPEPEKGWRHHPDTDLIFDLLAIDDEGQATYYFIKDTLGYEMSYVELEDDNPELAEKYYEEVGGDCSGWDPTKPEGDGWLLMWITDTDDGPVAMYGRKIK